MNFWIFLTEFSNACNVEGMTLTFSHIPSFYGGGLVTGRD